MDYVRILYTYIVEDFMYSGYLLLTLLLPCLIYQGLMEIKAKQNSRRVPAKYYFGVYVMLVYLWVVFKVTGIGLLADIVRLKDAISGGYNRNPLAGLGMGFVLNIIMFLPLGLLIPCIWKKCRSITNVTVTGFLLSLTIEISQIFNARATDIDDLLANTIFSLFVSLSRCIQDSYDNDHKVLQSRVDRKLMRVIRKKKMELGEKEENHMDIQ